jgi:hypothetical protein
MKRKNERSPGGQDLNEVAPRLSHLHRRALQAPVAACLIRAFAGVLGQDQALAIATEAIQADARMAGKTMAEQYGGHSMAVLARIVRETWAENGAMTVRFLAETELSLCFDVTRCRYAELYEGMGMKELGFCLSCSRDEPFARGFNPRLKLLRTQTIIQGAPFCDFRFILD